MALPVLRSSVAVPARSLCRPNSVLQWPTKVGLSAWLGTAVPMEQFYVTATVAVTVAASPLSSTASTVKVYVVPAKPLRASATVI